MFHAYIFEIPEYQRGYAWEKKQWNDFIQDIDALAVEGINNHYAGTIVIYQKKDKPKKSYGPIEKLWLVDVVDGQQRLATCCLYLSIIIHELVNLGKVEYKEKESFFLYSGSTCKLSLNNDATNFFLDLLKKGNPNKPALSTHEKRLLEAYNYLKKHIDEQHRNRGENYVNYLIDLYEAISSKLGFTFYTIEEECEIGMTFELMNSRGKELSILELLKNYLMYWVYRNITNDDERKSLTNLINKDWKDTYTNIGLCDGIEDQCLRTAWTLYCSPTPKAWKGYEGFKDDSYIPLRKFIIKTEEDTKEFIKQFIEVLALVSHHYSIITNPKEDNTCSTEEFVWLSKIHHTGNIANFLPLIVAAREQLENRIIAEQDYCELLKALECFAYRIFLYERYRSNAGKSQFFRFANDVFNNKQSIQDVIVKVHELINYYAKEETFIENLNKPDNWYSRRNLLRYTLFEYELWLLEKDGKSKKPLLQWNDLSDSTIEHILPQTPEENSHWREVWTDENIKTYLHDIGNLVLTKNNSNYLSFEFSRKKGSVGKSPSYSDSDIRQEREIAQFNDWRPEDLQERREKIVSWIAGRWKSCGVQIPLSLDINEQEDDDID